MVRHAFVVANKMLTSGCFRDELRKAKLTNTNGDSAKQVYEKLTSSPTKLTVELFNGSFLQNHIWRTVGYEDERFPNTTFMNRYFVNSVSMAADNLLHEAAHSRGYRHRNAKEFTSVPYTMNAIYDQCAPRLDSALGEQGTISEKVP